MSWRRIISSVLSPGRVGLLWLVTTLGVAVFLAFRMTGEDRSVFMPGSMIDGHHQIALACDRCHTPFGGVSQEACLDCHQAELETARDSHPEGKFTDPRNAALLVRLDARRCVACHTEHRAGDHRGHGCHPARRFLLSLSRRRGPGTADAQGSFVRDLRLVGLPQLPRQPRALRGLPRTTRRGSAGDAPGHAARGATHGSPGKGSSARP